MQFCLPLGTQSPRNGKSIGDPFLLHAVVVWDSAKAEQTIKTLGNAKGHMLSVAILCTFGFIQNSIYFQKALNVNFSINRRPTWRDSVKFFATRGFSTKTMMV